MTFIKSFLVALLVTSTILGIVAFLPSFACIAMEHGIVEATDNASIYCEGVI